MSTATRSREREGGPRPVDSYGEPNPLQTSLQSPSRFPQGLRKGPRCTLRVRTRTLPNRSTSEKIGETTISGDRTRVGQLLSRNVLSLHFPLPSGPPCLRGNKPRVRSDPFLSKYGRRPSSRRRPPRSTIPGTETWEPPPVHGSSYGNPNDLSRHEQIPGFVRSLPSELFPSFPRLRWGCGTGGGSLLGGSRGFLV